ncbi:hypothetical protein Syun_014865 [Stephania yunnanensis]|uniref:Uncharacterized protein n=1 Tax=Stephania yunnanensis TaxID=152371 RepID=A0AAP0PC91_9MAGN
MTETGATRRRDRERRQDRETRETESTERPRRRNQDHREQTSERAPERPARTTGRRDETIERDGRLGTRRSAGATRRRDGISASVVVDGKTVSLGLWDTAEEVVMVVETIDVVTEVVEENTICLIFNHFGGFREMCGYRFVVFLIGCRTLRIS